MKREDMKREDDDPMRDSPRGKSRQTADMTGTGLRLELTGMTPPRVPLVSWGLPVLTGVYFLAGKFGLSLAFVHASASAVWPPTGIALAATLLLGCRVWPALFLGRPDAAAEQQRRGQRDARRRPHRRRARVDEGERQPELPGEEVDAGEHGEAPRYERNSGWRHPCQL